MPPQTVGSAIGLSVLLVGRRYDRRLLNERNVLSALLSAPRGLVSPRRSRLVYFEGLTLAEQMRISAAAQLMIAIDGTGVANGLWMGLGSTLVDVLPYGASFAVRKKSDNFFRMLVRVGVRVGVLHLTDFRKTKVNDRLPWCAGCLENRSLRIRARKPRARRGPGGSMYVEDTSTCVRPLGQVYGCVFSQDSILPPDVAVELAHDAADYITWQQSSACELSKRPPRSALEARLGDALRYLEPVRKRYVNVQRSGCQRAAYSYRV